MSEVERTAQGLQIVMPGAERSAHQAVAARGDKLKPKHPQLPPAGLFERPHKPVVRDLF